MKKIIDINNIEFVKALIEGDEKVFAMLYKSLYPNLIAFATQFISIEDSKEVVQDTMMWLWENRSTLIPEMSLKSLLFTIVKNKSLNRRSQIEVQSKIHERLYDIFINNTIDADDYTYQEVRTLFYKGLSLLPESQRKAYIKNRFENKTYKEIAEIEGVSEKTIAYRIGLALKSLRITLRNYLPSLIAIM